MLNKNNFAVIAATGLVVGNLIGAGILALPISLGLVGAIPSLISILLYSSMMLFTADVLAREAGEAKNEHFDYPSLYGHYLGKFGKWIAIATNAILLYGVLIAYISGGTQIMSDILGITGTHIHVALILSVIFVVLTIMDLSIIHKYNTVLIIGLFLAFIGLIVLSVPNISTSRLVETHWQYFGLTIPLVVTASHFHNIIPTLCKELKWDVALLRKAMIFGMITAGIMNIAWTFCGIGCLERGGENGLVTAYVNNLPATVPMSNVLGSQWFTLLAVIFSMVAITTSFLANGLGLMNFVKDILHNVFKIDKLYLIRLVTFVPPVIIAIIWPDIFIKALNVAGGIGIVTLFGILPCLISVLKKGNSLKFKLLGGFFLILSILALIVVIGMLCNISIFNPNPQNELTSMLQVFKA